MISGDFTCATGGFWDRLLLKSSSLCFSFFTVKANGKLTVWISSDRKIYAIIQRVFHGEIMAGKLKQ
jgi:hypothetical protein